MFFLSFLQQNTVPSTVHQPPLRIQIQTDCVVVQMGNHVDEAEETIILHHHLTLIWRYFILDVFGLLQNFIIILHKKPVTYASKIKWHWSSLFPNNIFIENRIFLLKNLLQEELLIPWKNTGYFFLLLIKQSKQTNKPKQNQKEKEKKKKKGASFSQG